MRGCTTLLAALVLAACGGKQTPQPQPQLDDGSGSGSATPPVATDAGSGSGAPLVGGPTCALEQAGVANVDCGIEWLGFFSKRMCQCTTQDCAKAVSDELQSWSNSVPDSVKKDPGTDEQNARGNALGQQLATCIAKLYDIEPGPGDGAPAPAP